MGKNKETVSVRLIDLGRKNHTQNKTDIPSFTFVAEKNKTSIIQRHDYLKISKCYKFLIVCS